MEALTLNFSGLDFTDEQFDNLCRQNEDLRFEWTARDQLIVLPAESSGSAGRNLRAGSACGDVGVADDAGGWGVDAGV
jgi:Uma2 family endonuclease